MIAVCLLIAITWFFMHAGMQLQTDATIVKNTPSLELKEIFSSSVSHPLSVFIIQLTVIIIASRICAFLAKKAGQPEVMGETIAGIVLGPSLIGTLFPAFSKFVFPASSLGNIQMLSQVGLILFMFVIGIELDLSIIKQKAKTAFFISFTSIILPFASGITLSFYMYKSYAPA